MFSLLIVRLSVNMYVKVDQEFFFSLTEMTDI